MLHDIIRTTVRQILSWIEMKQKIVTCSSKVCWGFFVDTREERRKADMNGWRITNKALCPKHRYVFLRLI